ncbi:MAG: dethiobiotin synthase [Azonexus sp.]|jgi:dethiobiotin synthetase|nr:dethiobiotin synthase [Azonexus sp.]
MKRAYFLTGTDTGVGKTFVAAALLHRAAQRGLSSAGLKPVAAGVDATGRNEDVEALRAASSVQLAAAVVNPYCFEAAIAPHLAAAEAGRAIAFAPILAACQEARAAADFVIVEGVGGFRVPLGADGDSADLAVALGLPVILVVGMRLGCINHAMLSFEAIAARRLTCAGWVANPIDPAMARFAANLHTLCELLPAPLLGVTPHTPDSRSAAAALELPV